MKRLLFSLLMFLIIASFPAHALDLKKSLKDYIKENLPDKEKVISSGKAELRQKLIEKLKSHWPDQAKNADEVLGEVSQTEEIAIGRQIAGDLLGAVPLVADPRLQKYVNQVGRWVAEQGERSNLQWHFGVIESDAVNAFAAPGGYIVLTRGLYALLENEAELAGVLAHEIGHVQRKHHLRILQKSHILDIGKQLLSKKVSNNEIVQKAIGSGAEIVARALDKNAEFEADRIAVVLTARAGYDAFSLPAVLQLIGHFAVEDDRVELLFKTHPHPDSRLDKLDRSMGGSFDKIEGQALPQRFYQLKPKKMLR